MQVPQWCNIYDSKRERERERERWRWGEGEREREREREREDTAILDLRNLNIYHSPMTKAFTDAAAGKGHLRTVLLLLCVCVYVCVCEREQERVNV